MSQDQSKTAGAFSSMVNFPDHKKRSASGQIDRVILPAVNGNSFFCGQSVDLVIPGNSQSGFMDAHNSYLRFKINYNRTANSAGHRLRLPPLGVYNCIKKIELLCGGVSISSIDEYAKLACLVLDADQSISHRNGSSSVQYGMGSSDDADKNVGAELDGGATGTGLQETQLCLSLLMTPLFGSSKYIPLFGDELRLRITLNDFSSSFISGTRGTTQANDTTFAGLTSSVTFSPFEMVMYKVTMDDVPLAMIKANAGDQYTLILNDYTNSKGQLAAGDTSSVFNTGFSYTSLSRVFFAFYPALTDARRRIADSERHKITRNVTDYCFNVSGKNIPSQKLQGDAATVLTENKCSLRLLGDFQHDTAIDATNFNIATYTDDVGGRAADKTGTRSYDIDLESLKNYSDENGLYSGISTIGKTTSVQVNYSGGGACECNMWAEHQIGLSLDMSPTGSRTWKVIV